MRTRKDFWVVTCLAFGLMAAVFMAGGEAWASAKLVVTSVSGPPVAEHEKAVSISYTVENKGDTASGAFQVSLYLSTDKAIVNSKDRLLKNVSFSSGLQPGQIKQATTSVIIPAFWLSGNYYYGAIVADSKRASLNPVYLPRFSLSDGGVTVMDHMTGLIWQRDDNPQFYGTWSQAKKFCSDLVFADHSDWRLPTVDELATLLSYLRYYAIDEIFHANQEPHWTITDAVIEYQHVIYVVDHRLGSVFRIPYSTDTKNIVRCVRGGP